MNPEQELRKIHQLNKVSSRNAPKIHKELLSKEIEAKIVLTVTNNKLKVKISLKHSFFEKKCF